MNSIASIIDVIKTDAGISVMSFIVFFTVFSLWAKPGLVVGVTVYFVEPYFDISDIGNPSLVNTVVSFIIYAVNVPMRNVALFVIFNPIHKQSFDKIRVLKIFIIIPRAPILQVEVACLGRL